MSRKHKGSGGYKRAHKLGFTSYKRSLSGQVTIHHKTHRDMFLRRHLTQWQVVRDSLTMLDAQRSPLFQSLTMACIWAQLEGWV